MPTPRNNLADYPPEYSDIFRRAMTEAVRLPCTNIAEANTRRSMLYTFRTRLIDEPEFDPELALIAPSIRTRLEHNDSGKSVTIIIYT